jgi:outer membrane protein OmpA-like peptidoglycan-associated protein
MTERRGRKVTMGSITKLCVAAVLLSASVVPSQAASPKDGATVDRQPAIATVAQIDALEKYSVASLKRVHFSAGHSNLSRREQAMLAQIPSTLYEHNASVIELRGYADGAATPAANMALSIERAMAIARFLNARGVARGRILILGLGEVDPAGPPLRAEHQRVDVRVLTPPTAEASLRHASVTRAFIQDTWGGKMEPSACQWCGENHRTNP